MKVLQINSVYNFGSTGRIVKDIHNYLLENGVDSYVIFSRNDTGTANLINTKRFYSGFDFYKHVIFGVLLDRHGLYSNYNTKKIIQEIKSINPNLIHLHNIHGFYLNYPMLFSFLKKFGKPIVWTLHDCWSYTGYCAYYDYNKCNNWEDGCHKCKYRNGYPYRVFSNSENNIRIKKDAYTDLKVDLVTPSIWLKQEISHSILKDKSCIVIPNTVNLSDFYYEKSDVLERNGLANKRVYLAVASYWTLQKGFNEYLKLANLLNDDERLVMIGLNNKQIKRLPNRIIGFSRMNSADLRKWYSSAEYLINLTLEDNYPTINIEAQSCGTPVISYNTGGSPEMLEDKTLVVEKYDIGKVLLLARNKHARIKQVSQQVNMVEQYYLLYKQLLKL